ncbi:unnamed protein product [Rotaria socialis]|uniref:Uncharacterized protein n=1 Tax=Rotaria socialis TaxID=392032 RepID=A0A820KSA8_9BILA|nr:unnamed protein product [Rotaria socialis]
MYQHIRIALEYAQQRSQHVQEQENIRRCRKTIEKYPTARANEDETTSNNPTEISHHSSTDDNETLDVDNDFDLDSVEEISNEPLISDELFSPNNDQNDNFLHFYTTTTKTWTFCRQIVEIFKDANISNIHCLRILKLISSVLSQPHNSPTTSKALYDSIKYNLKQCNLNYLSRQNNNNDIIFNQVYKELQSRRGSSSSISLLLHLDGISLCKSSKLNLWLLSCSLIELPVHLRYRRFNVIVLSVWIGHCEPLVDLWLEESFQQLNDVKKKSISTRSGINYKIIVYGLAGDCPAIKLPTKHISHQGYICCWLCYTHVIDYMHVSLLRHTRTIIQYIYQEILKPKQRDELDDLFRHQAFPHHVNRKMCCVKDFSYCKASELRNMLLYDLLPLIRSFLPVKLAAHLALYVTAMRHLHVHYANQYRLHGSLSNFGTFGQESLLGHFAKNQHGTSLWRVVFGLQFQVDFPIPNSQSTKLSFINGALHECHNALCSCDKIDQCISIYRRCRLKHMVYHSLLYRRRGSSVSYFAQYSKGHDDNLFDKIDLFFKCSFEDCNSEYARVTRLSQDQADDQNDDDSIQDPINIINSSMTNIRSSKIDRTHLSSSTSSSPRISTCAQISEKIDVEVYTIFVRSISTASAVFEK